MKTQSNQFVIGGTRLRHALFLLALAAATPQVWAQGGMTPPGPPGPMMKTLQQIEPRTPIGSLPYRITNSGSFYLTGDLVGVAGQGGILIQASNVTLDLNGFSLIGVADSANGIDIVAPPVSGPPPRNVTVMNGIVRSWGSSGIRAWSASGSEVTVMNVRASSNGAYGINVQEGTVILCHAFGNFGGIAMRSGLVKDCQAYNNTGNGIGANGSATVIACIANSNQARGISVGAGSTVQDSMTSSNRTEGISVTDHCRVIRNSSIANSYGIRAWGQGNRIEENHTAENSTMGFKVDASNGFNVIVKNTAKNSTSTQYRNYSIAAGNFFGPEITINGTLRGTHPDNHPWANFSEYVLI